MTEDDLLTEFGLHPRSDGVPSIREVLRAEEQKERSSQGNGNTELMKLCCVQLFLNGDVADSLTVWRAKTASMDAYASIDIQLMCSRGLAETRRYLDGLGTEEATTALRRLTQAEETGDFDGFTVVEYREFWARYYDCASTPP